MSTADDKIFRQALHPDRRLRRAELRPCRDHSGPDYPGHQTLELASASSGNTSVFCVEPPDVELLRETFRTSGTLPAAARDELIGRLRYNLAYAAWAAVNLARQTARDKTRSTGEAYAYGRALHTALRLLGQPPADLDWTRPEGELPLPSGAEKAAREFLGIAADTILGQETP